MNKVELTDIVLEGATLLSCSTRFFGVITKENLRELVDWDRRMTISSAPVFPHIASLSLESPEGDSGV